ncbi:MAG: MC/SLC25 family protein [Gammaproteobacteria bacterium]|nr:MC/SLC25 family protein [Gammaproteobacteria bacterium]
MNSPIMISVFEAINPSAEPFRPFSLVSDLGKKIDTYCPSKEHVLRSSYGGVAIALFFNDVDRKIVRQQTGTIETAFAPIVYDKAMLIKELHRIGLGVAKQVLNAISLLYSIHILENAMMVLSESYALSKMVAGIGAGAIQAYISNPLAIRLVKLQTAASPVKSSISELKPAGLWAGAASTAVRNSSFWAILLASTHTIEEQAKKWDCDTDTFKMLNSIFCSLAACMVTTPIATVSNCQRNDSAALSNCPSKGSAPFFNTARTIVKTRGLLGLYAGAGLSMQRMVGVGSLMHLAKSTSTVEGPCPDHEAENYCLRALL